MRRLEVFGSAARSSDFDLSRSDADFLVDFDRSAPRGSNLSQFFELKESLAKVIGRPVDLVESRAIKNPYLLNQIERERQLVYAA